MILAQALNALADAAVLFLIASGLTIVFGVSRIVNFAHGSLAMLGAYLGSGLIAVLPAGDGPWWLAVLVATLAVAALGVVIEIIVLRPLYRAPELVQLVATFGLVLILRETARLIWGPQDRTVPAAPALQGVWQGPGVPIPAHDAVMVLVAALVLAALMLLFQRTRFGILIRAATEDREMLAALGVHQRWLFTATFALGAGLAGLGGAIALPRNGAALNLDLTLIAEAFVITVVGGLGSVAGAALAALVIASLKVVGVLIYSPVNLVTPFLVMGAVLVLRPQGLLGRRGAGPMAGAASVATLSPGAPVVLRAPRGWPLVASWAGAGLLLAVGLLAGDGYTPVLMTAVAIACLFAVSLHLAIGIGGLVSFGHAAFLGLGAYGAALLVLDGFSTGRYGAEPLLPGAPALLDGLLPAVLAGMLWAGLAAAAVGIVAVRLGGVVFSMFTLAAAQILWSLVFQADRLTGGDNGLLGTYPPPWLDQPQRFFAFTFAVCFAAIWALRRAALAPFGYALRAARDHPARAAAIGLPVARLRWVAFTAAGTGAGLAGALHAFQGAVDPTLLEIPQSVDGLVMVLLGGVETLAGPVVGAVALTLAEDWLVGLGQITLWGWTLALDDVWRGLLGVLILVVTLVAPHGIVGAVRRHLPPAWTGRQPEDPA